MTTSVSEKNRPLVFVTGPYSAPTEEEVARNIQSATEIGRKIFQKGYKEIYFDI